MPGCGRVKVEWDGGVGGEPLRTEELLRAGLNKAGVFPF